MRVSQRDGEAAPVPLRRRRVRRAGAPAPAHERPPPRPPAALPARAPDTIYHAVVAVVTAAVTLPPSCSARAGAVKAREQGVVDATAATVEGGQTLGAAEPHQDPRRVVTAAGARVRDPARGARRRRRRRQELGRGREHLRPIGPRRPVRCRRDVGHAEVVVVVVVVVVHHTTLPGGSHRGAQAPALPAPAKPVR